MNVGDMDASIRQGLLTVFVPVYNESESLPPLFEDITWLDREIKSIGGEIEVLFHDNFSTDGSWKLIQNFASETNVEVKAKRFAKNIGYQPSLALSFSNASGDAFAVYQSDRQDPIEIIVQMYQRWTTGENCIVATAESRAENLKDKLGRSAFVWLMRYTSDLQIQKWFTDFYLLDKSLYSQLIGLPAINQFIRGLIVQHFEIDSYLSYHRRQRQAGESNFNFARKYSLAFDGLLLHGTRLIRRTTLFSLFSSLVFAIGGLCSTVFVSFLHPQFVIHALVISLSFFLMSFVLGMLGIILEYQIRIHQRLHAPSWLIENHDRIYLPSGPGQSGLEPN